MPNDSCAPSLLLIDEPSPAELEARDEARMREAMALYQDGRRFIGTSLGAWLDEAKAACVQFVPAEEIFTIIITAQLHRCIT